MTIATGALDHAAALADLSPPLRDIGVLTGEGLELRLRSGFRTAGTGAPGYLFDVSMADGTPVGRATAVIATDLAQVERIGHIGTEVVPALRRQGYTVRMARVLMQLLREHGLTEVLLTCDEGHASQAQSCRDVGGEELDLLPALAPGQPRKQRFLAHL